MRIGFQLTAAALIVGSLQFAGCKETAKYTKLEPAEVERKEGQPAKVKLSEKAVERLGVQTTAVREAAAAAEGQAAQIAVPYSSIVYLTDGTALVYTSPEPRVFVSQPVEVDYIEGDTAVLKNGPALGVQVASVGVQEIFGEELGVGH
jgi:outer membrane murein-binding lipoprotein Lpp